MSTDYLDSNSSASLFGSHEQESTAENELKRSEFFIEYRIAPLHT